MSINKSIDFIMNEIYLNVIRCTQTWDLMNALKLSLPQNKQITIGCFRTNSDSVSLSVHGFNW